MLLNFIKVDFRTKVLVDKYLELISDGVKPSEILVLVQNSTLKKQFIDKILKNIKVDATEKLNVHSFFSIVYNTLVENWCFVENSIPSKKAFILPNLAGLEVSQFLLKDILKQVDVKGYNSKHSLLHQIFRRYSTKIGVSIIFYIDFLCTSYFSYLSYIIGNTEKAFVPLRLLFFLFINNFYHLIFTPF